MRWVTALLVLGVSCGKPSRHATPPDAATPTSIRRTAQRSVEACGSAGEPNLEPSSAPPLAPRSAARRPQARPPENGCLVRSTSPIDADTRAGLAGQLGEMPFALAFGREVGRVALWTLAERPSRRRWTLALEAPIARAAVRCEARCTLAVVDARGVLQVFDFDLTAADAPRVLARGVDRRFAPALAGRSPATLVAYTTTRDEVMHTLLARAGDTRPHRDLTPPGHGAAAPTFVLGASPTTLVMIDARAGLSPLLELTLDAQGTPSAVQVRTPVIQPSAPPLLAATVLRSGEVEVYYSLIGRLAMTAIGRVPLRRAQLPTPLLASRGYGALNFVAARSRMRTLVALEVPTATPPSAPRTLVLELLDGARTDEVLALDGYQPSLASGPEPGTFVLTYATASGLHASTLGCDD